MRNKLGIIALSLFSILVVFSSCEKNCGTCGAKQTCVSGTCQCTQGLEGDNCDIRSNAKFVGSYTVYESYNPAYQGQSSQTFNCTILAGNSSLDNVYFDNFAGTGLNVRGVINTIYITIPDQDVGASHIAGEGTFNVSLRRMELKYQITTGSEGSVVTSNYQHQ